MFDYQQARSDADAIIREFAGARVEYAAIRVKTTTGGDEITPGTHTHADYPVVMAVVDYSETQDGTAQNKQRQVLVSPLAPDGSALAIQPSSAHQLVLGSESYEIVESKPLDPAGVDVMYELRVQF